MPKTKSMYGGWQVCLEASPSSKEASCEEKALWPEEVERSEANEGCVLERVRSRGDKAEERQDRAKLRSQIREEQIIILLEKDMPKILFLTAAAAALASCQDAPAPQTSEKVPIEISISNNNQNEIEVVIESQEDGDNVTVTTTVTQTDNETDVNSVCQINGDNSTDNRTCPDNLTSVLKLWLDS
jgi:hypothetical protein